MNSVRLPRLRRDFDSKMMAHTAHKTHTGASVCHVCHSAMMTHMAHALAVLVLAVLVLAVLVLAVCWLAVLVLAVCWHTRHTARRPAASGPAAWPWQRRGGGSRAERLGPQLRSVSEQFLFLWYKTEHDVTAVIY